MSEWQRQEKTKKALPSAGSIPKCPQHPWPGLSKAMSCELHSGVKKGKPIEDGEF